MTIRCTNRESGQFVNARVAFTTNNKTLFGKWQYDDINGLSWYAVYSYGGHFPIYVYDPDADAWYGNKDRYGPTTSRHQSAARPDGSITWLETREMRHLAEYGVVGSWIARFKEAA